MSSIEQPDDEDLASAFSDPKIADRLDEALPATYAAAARFWRSAHAVGALTARMRELILIALYGTVTTLHDEGLTRHVKRALAHGASGPDILDVLFTIVGVANHALYFAVPVLMRELAAAGYDRAELPSITPEAQAIKDEFIEARGFWNPQRDPIVQMMPDYFAALSGLTTEPWQKGALSPKERELVCVAIDCTVTHMFEPGLAIHIRNALKNGATREEILEVFQLASLTGLEGYILGAEALYSAGPG